MLDESLVLTTPENVPITYEVAGVGSRFLAALIDALLIVVTQLGIFSALFFAIFLLGTAFGLAEELSSVETFPWNSYMDWVGAIFVVLYLVVLFIYPLVYPLFFEIILSGQTPGKRMAGLRVVKGDGGPITAIAAVIRNVIRIVDFLPAYYIIAVIIMLLDRKARRLGDMAAGTICIKERRDVAVQRLSLAPPARESGSALNNLSRLSHDDYYLVKEYLLRRSQMAQGPARTLGAQIANRLAAKLEVEHAGQSADTFLAYVGSALERRGWR